MAFASKFFASTTVVFSVAVLLRVALLVYGHLQDQFSSLKYTDIDYYVFTDAANYVYHGRSPYLRATYRYTPLLAWLLVPTAWSGLWFQFGKVLFAASDILAGWLILKILKSTKGMPTDRALKYASLWLLNPMVAQISTRGSSEGILAVMVMALLWATLTRRVTLSGILLGVAVHFKIYPFIYGASILWWMEDDQPQIARSSSAGNRSPRPALSALFTADRLKFVLSSAVCFTLLNLAMFVKYGGEFLSHTYIYHLIRTDHRHNFSVYNLLLYQSSSPASPPGMRPETLAFLPQILLSAILLPLMLARKDLSVTMLAQTFAFVAFNKVCTSQYFLWYLVFLPFYLPSSSLLANPRLGFTALILWILGQALWLQQGFQLEFNGYSMFSPNLWLASTAFFAVNIWILGLIINDISGGANLERAEKGKKTL